MSLKVSANQGLVVETVLADFDGEARRREQRDERERRSARAKRDF